MTSTAAAGTNPTVDPDPTLPRTIYDVKAASVDDDPDFTGTLTVSGSFRDDEGRHHTVVLRFPAADVPGLMRARRRSSPIPRRRYPSRSGRAQPAKVTSHGTPHWDGSTGPAPRRASARGTGISVTSTPRHPPHVRDG